MELELEQQQQQQKSMQFLVEANKILENQANVNNCIDGVLKYISSKETQESDIHIVNKKLQLYALINRMYIDPAIQNNIESLNKSFFDKYVKEGKIKPGSSVLVVNMTIRSMLFLLKRGGCKVDKKLITALKYEVDNIVAKNPEDTITDLIRKLIIDELVKIEELKTQDIEI